MSTNKIKLSPGVLWITGLSGSGKSTISKIIFLELRKKYKNLMLLDGDKLRKKLKIKKTGSFNYNARKKIGLKYSRLCKYYLKKDFYIIIAVMALIKSVHKWNRKNLVNYKDVYLNVPLEELEKRDPKKIYKKFREKKIKNVAGFDLKYDIPNKANLIINWKKNLSAKRTSKMIIMKFFKK